MRIILLAFMAVLAFPSQAQLWEQADQPTEMVHWDQALPVGGGRWAVIGGPTSAGSHAISVRNADATVAWEEVGQYGNDGYMGQVVLMPDSGLLRAGLFDGCDYAGNDSQVRRYTPDGTLLWERIITPLFTWPVTMAAKGSIDHIAIASPDSVYILDLAGNTTGGFEVPSGDVHGICWASDSILFLVKGTALRLVDMQGSELASATIGPDVLDMHWDGLHLFVLANDSVRRFSPDLLPIGSHALPGMDGNSRFVPSDSALYVNTATGLYQLADDGTATLLFPWPALPNLTTTGCAVRSGTVLAVGNTDISGRNTGIIRTLSMNGDAAQHDQDVEVLLQVDSAWTEYSGTPYYPWDRKADLTGFVVNHGTDTLHSVVLSMWKYVPFLLCDPFTNRIDTSGFSLAPGDTIALPFGVVGVALGLAQSQVADASGEICIVALAPDHLADRDPNDNTACETVNFPMGIGNIERQASLNLAPNPAVNTCVLSGLAALGTPVQVRILDLTGRIVAEQNSIGSSHNLELDISSLAPATYLVVAEGSNVRAMAKLVVASP
ncbi:MAG: T9SS type A sorting domain-containing protein [Flavobacteriales bacterium]|nr:T9SS type A sorting domain-containing protein [Flavobacteriales bacterium]